MKKLELKDFISFGVMLAAIVAWGARLESKIMHHETLPYHTSVPEMVERRITEKLELSRAKDAANMAKLLGEIRNLQESVAHLRNDIAELRKQQRRRYQR